MNTPDKSSAAARLCAQCGLCCNGVMFNKVRLLPGDSAKELAALGLKLKRRKGHHFILQPCPAFQDSRCSIYAARPERCRNFECQQLKRLAAGEITEALALEKIKSAWRMVEQLNKLLQRSGTTNLKQPLSKRCEKVMAEPVNPTVDHAALALRNQLQQVRRELETLLDDDFRTTPSSPLGEAESDTVGEQFTTDVEESTGTNGGQSMLTA